MSSAPPRALKRTQPDGTRSAEAGDVKVIPERDEVRALRDALNVILAANRRNSRSGAQGEAIMLGISDATVCAAAHVVRRAHEALHEQDDLSEIRQRRCAEVLLTALPESVSHRLILADVIAQVRVLARERDGKRAIPLATAALLGWTDIAHRSVARAVEVVVARSGPKRS